MGKIVTKMTAKDWEYVGLKRYPQDDFSDDGSRFRMYIYKDFLEVSYCTGEGEKYLSIRPDYSSYNNTDYDFWKHEFPDASSRDWNYNGVSKIDLDALKEDLEVVYQALQEAPAKYAEFCKAHLPQWKKETLDKAEKAVAIGEEAVEAAKKIDFLSLDFSKVQEACHKDDKYTGIYDFRSFKSTFENVKQDLYEAEKVLRKVETDFEAADRKAYFTDYHAQCILDFVKHIA